MIGSDNMSGSETETVVPLLEEHAFIAKNALVTGHVRVQTHVEEHEELLQATLGREEVRIDRVAINQVVTEVPVMRMDGDVLIYPVMEEVLVVEKRLVLKEELRISRRHVDEDVEQRVTLRREHADVERTLVEHT